MIVWKDRKRRGKNINSAHYTCYEVGADAYIGGKKVGGVSHSGGTWWFILQGKQSPFFESKESAKDAFEKEHEQ